jgi:hypothetical protein
MSDQSGTKSVTRQSDELPGDTALREIEDELVRGIDEAIDRLEFVDSDEHVQEHLEVLRATLRAQVRGYLEHLISRRAILMSHTSVMYAESAGTSGVVATSLRGLLDAGTLTREQGMRIMQFVTDRRTLVVVGQHRTGKSTLLNALFEFVSVDERIVAIKHGQELPALRDRSFCLRLDGYGAASLPALFAKARQTDPSRLVLDDMRAAELGEFFGLLASSPRCGGMSTLKARTAEEALASLLDNLPGNDQERRQYLARTKPVFLHMSRDHSELPRLESIWSAEPDGNSVITLHEVKTSFPSGHELVAEA